MKNDIYAVMVRSMDGFCEHNVVANSPIQAMQKYTDYRNENKEFAKYHGEAISAMKIKILIQ